VSGTISSGPLRLGNAGGDIRGWLSDYSLVKDHDRKTRARKSAGFFVRAFWDVGGAHTVIRTAIGSPRHP
jgi:hypothetical protein